MSFCRFFCSDPIQQFIYNSCVGIFLSSVFFVPYLKDHGYSTADAAGTAFIICLLMGLYGLNNGARRVEILDAIKEINNQEHAPAGP